MTTMDNRLSWRQLLAFSSPTFAYAGHEIALGMFLPFFLSQSTTVSLGSVAWLIFGYQLWDALNDPLIGWLSDRWHWGGHRRFAPMLWGTPIAMAGTALIFFATRDLSLWALGVTLFMTALGWTLINVPHGAWALELRGGAHERTRVFASRNLVGTLATPLFLLAPAYLEHVYGSNTRHVGALLCGLILITQPLSLLLIAPFADRRLTLRAAVDASPHRHWFSELRSVMRLDGAGALIALFACLGAATSVRNGLMLFWLTYAVGLAAWSWALILLNALVAAAVTPLWLRVHRRVGTPRTLASALIIALAATVWIPLVPHGSGGAVIVFALLNGASTGAAFMLIRTMLGDLLDRPTQGAPHGRPAGLLYSTFHLLYNSAAAVAISLALALLARAGFDPKHAAAASHTAGVQLISVMVWGALIPQCLGLATLIVIMRKSRTIVY